MVTSSEVEGEERNPRCWRRNYRQLGGIGRAPPPGRGSFCRRDGDPAKDLIKLPRRRRPSENLDDAGVAEFAEIEVSRRSRGPRGCMHGCLRARLCTVPGGRTPGPTVCRDAPFGAGDDGRAAADCGGGGGGGRARRRRAARLPLSRPGERRARRRGEARLHEPKHALCRGGSLAGEHSGRCNSAADRVWEGERGVAETGLAGLTVAQDRHGSGPWREASRGWQAAAAENGAAAGLRVVGAWSRRRRRVGGARLAGGSGQVAGTQMQVPTCSAR